VNTFVFDAWVHLNEQQVRERCRELSRSVFREQEKRIQFEEEVECAHMWLDDQGIPRVDVGGEVFSLVGRMMLLRSRS
jgi:hypothetical protein